MRNVSNDLKFIIGFANRFARLTFAWVRSPITMVLLLSTISACTPKSDKLFATDCENNNPNCADSELLFTTIGSRTDVHQAAIANGGKHSDAILMKPIRKGEKTGVQFTITNYKLAPLRDFSMTMSPGGLPVDSSSDDDCSKKVVMLYNQSCTFTINFTGIQTLADQTLDFDFKSIRGEAVHFQATLSGAMVLSDFYLDGDTSFAKDEVVFATDYSPDPFPTDRKFIISNEGTKDDIKDLSWVISGANADEFTLISDGSADSCVEGQTLGAGGGSCSVKIRFKPLAPGTRNATLSLNGSDEFGRSYALDGHAIMLETNHSKLDFGLRSLSDGVTEQFVMLSLPMSASSAAQHCSYTISGDPQFALSPTTNCSDSFSAGQSCDLGVQFTPAAAAEVHHAKLDVICNERGGNLSIELVAQSALSTIAIDKNILDFGEKLVGSTTSAQLTLTDKGSAPFTNLVTTFSAITGTDLLQTLSTCTDTLLSQQSCSATITFAPGTTSASTASFYATSDQSSMDSETLIQGRGISITASQDNLDFGTVLIGKDRLGADIRIINPSTSQAATGCSLDSASLSAQGISLEEGSTCTTAAILDAGESCLIKPRFTASGEPGTRDASLLFSCMVGGQVTLNLHGEAANDLRLVVLPPTSVNFESRLVGIRASSNFTIMNAHSSDPANGLSAGPSGSVISWSRGNAGSSDCSLKTNLLAGQTCQIKMDYAPRADIIPEEAFYTNGSIQVSADGGLIDPPDPTFKANALKIMASKASYHFGYLSTGIEVTSPFILVENPSPIDTASGCSLQSTAGFETTSSSCGATLLPKQICAFRLRAKAQSSSVNLNGTTTMACAVGGRAVITLKFVVQKPPTLQWSALSTTDFGFVDIGSDKALSFRLSNLSASNDRVATNLALNVFSYSGTNRFSLKSTDCKTTLGFGESCTAEVNFHPTSTTAATGQIRATEKTELAQLALQGVGVDSGQRVVLSSNSISFSNRLIGIQTFQDITLSNMAASGSAIGLAITPPSSGAPWSQGVSASPCSSSIAVSSSCTTRIEYKPTSTGTTSGTVLITASNMTSSQTINYSGSATQISANQTLLDFGTLPLYTPKTHSTIVTVLNPSTVDSTSSCLLSTTDANFEIVSPASCTSPISPGGTCTFAVKVLLQRSDVTLTGKAIMSCAVGGSIAVDLAAQITSSGSGGSGAVDSSQRVVLSSNSVNFSNRLVGVEAFQDITLTNMATSGSAVDLSIGNPSSGAPWSQGTSADPCSSTLGVSETCSARLEYKPTTTGSTSGTVLITASNMTSSQTITYSGSAIQIAADTGSLDFGVLPFNSPKTLATLVTVSNPSALDTATSCALSTTDSNFEIVSPSTCSNPIAPGSTCAFAVRVTSQTSEQTLNGKALMTCGVGGSISVDLTAQIKHLTNLTLSAVAPSSANFGNWDIDAGALTKLYTLTNHEPDPVQLTKIDLKMTTSSFNIIAGGTTCSTSSPLAGNSSCTIAVAFDPTTDSTFLGGESAILYAEISNPMTHDYELTLTGTGTTMNLIASPTSLTFLKREVGQAGTESQTLTLTNAGSRNANLSYSSLFAPLSITSTTCGSTLVSGASCSISFSIQAHSSAQIHNQTYTISDTLGSNIKNLSIGLLGETVNAPALKIAIQDDSSNFLSSIASTDITSGSASPSREIYGLSPSYQEVTFTLKNTEANGAGLKDLSLNMEPISGAEGTINLISNTCTTLASNQTCSFKARYTPITNYEDSHIKITVSAKSDLSDTSQSVVATDVFGRSRRAVDLGISPSSYTFATPLEVANAGTTTFTVTNNGDQKATGLTYLFSGSNPSFFSTLGSSTCSTELAGNSSCKVYVTFNPGTTAAAFTANLEVNASQLSVPKSAGLKAASYSSQVASTANYTGLEPSITSDADRIYMLSRKTKDQFSSSYRPILTVCKRTNTGMADLATCEENEIVTRLGLTDPSQIANSNFASDQEGSGPRVSENGDKIIIAVENKDANLGATPLSVATVVVCQKPATGSTQLGACTETIIDNTASSGQFPELVVTSSKVLLTTTNATNDLNLYICDFDGSKTVSQALNFGSCKKTSLDHASSEQGRYPSLAFENNRVVISTRTSGSENPTGYLKIQACEINTTTNPNAAENCNKTIIDESTALLNEGLYPSVALKNNRAYIVHQQMALSDSGILRLTWCDLNSTPNSIIGTLDSSSCKSQTVSSAGIVVTDNPFYQTPTIAVMNNRAWITSSYLADPQNDTTFAAIDVRYCDISTSTPSCTATPKYVSYPVTQGSFPLLTRSAYLDTTFKMIISPFTAIDNSHFPMGYDKQLGVFQLGLLPEL